MRLKSPANSPLDILFARVPRRASQRRAKGMLIHLCQIVTFMSDEYEDLGPGKVVEAFSLAVWWQHVFGIHVVSGREWTAVFSDGKAVMRS